MVQYYTLEQAAQLLRVTPDQLKEMVKAGKVRAFQDRGTLRFRTQEIDEMARKQGLGSDPGLPLGEAPPKSSAPSSSARRRSKAVPPPEDEEDSDDFDFTLSPDANPAARSKPPSSKTKGTPPGGPKGSGRPSKLGTPPPRSSDSDVRLVADGSDLDFQLSLDDDPPPPAKSKSPSSKSPRTSRPESPPPRSSKVDKSPPRSSKLDSSRSSKSKLGPTPPKGDSSVRLVPPASDSDVKIVPDSPADSSIPIGQKGAQTPSDSDIRLEANDLLADLEDKRPGSDPLITEEIDLDQEEKKAAESAGKKRRPGKSKLSRPSGSVELPTSSPFELSEADLDVDGSGKAGKKESKGLEDSSSDFELTPLGGSEPNLELGSGENSPLADSDDEVAIGADVSGATGASGINLQDPADSGISLEEDGSDEMEFELTIDDGNTPKPTSAKDPSSSSEFELSLDEEDAPPASDSEFELSLEDDSGSSEIALDEGESGSDSEFELTLDEEGGLQPVDDTSNLAEGEESDLFEETDFEVPSLDDESGSQAMALDDDSSSDFDLAVDDSVIGEEDAPSESQVVPLDDESGEVDESAETVARPAARKSKLAGPSLEDEGLDLDLKSGDEGTPDEELGEDEDLETEADEEGATPVRVREVPVEAPPAPWGAVPVILMFPAVIILFVVGLMGFELIQGMWGYHKTGRITGMVIDPIAKMFDFDNALPKERE